MRSSLQSFLLTYLQMFGDIEPHQKIECIEIAADVAGAEVLLKQYIQDKHDVQSLSELDDETLTAVWHVVHGWAVMAAEAAERPLTIKDLGDLTVINGGKKH